LAGFKFSKNVLHNIKEYLFLYTAAYCTLHNVTLVVILAPYA